MMQLIEELQLRDSPWKLRRGLQVRTLKKGSWKYRNWRRLSYCSNKYWMQQFRLHAPDFHARALTAVPLDGDGILLQDSQILRAQESNWGEASLAYWRFSRHPRNLTTPSNFIERTSLVIHGQPLQVRRYYGELGR